MAMRAQRSGYKTHGTSQISKHVHQACMRNLALYLQGQISYEDWRSRQEELESRLTPEPELPFETWEPKTPEAA